MKNLIIKATIAETSGYVMIVAGAISHQYVFCFIGAGLVVATYTYAFKKMKGK